MTDSNKPAALLELTNLRGNIMGTTSFDAKFPGMRKAQDFIVYPLDASNEARAIKIQSDTRIGSISMVDGTVRMSAPQAGGAFFHHMATAKVLGKLTGEALLMLQAKVMSTAHGQAGKSFVKADNSGALNVFGAGEAA